VKTDDEPMRHRRETQNHLSAGQVGMNLGLVIQAPLRATDAGIRVLIGQLKAESSKLKTRSSKLKAQSSKLKAQS
jgi:hypothetical protein